MENVRVLVVEDERDINNLIALHFEREGFIVDQVYDGVTALEVALKNSYAVMVLDWMLPGKTGIDILKELRSHKKSDSIAVIMTTAKGQPNDVILGLESGADDYISKPYDMDVLKARVKALLRRNPMVSTSDKSVVKVGELKLNIKEHVVTCRGSEIDLTISEFKLLAALMMNLGSVLSRKSLIAEIQGEGVSVVDRSIDTHMVGLRKKIGSCSDYIKTVRGVGYKIEGE